MIRFSENVPIGTIKGSVYNPRKITDSAISDLERSISIFGMVKPLIVNSVNNVIIAGHQRKRAAEAIGIKYLPCVFVNSPSIQDELNFNLMHNSIETSDSHLTIKGGSAGEYKYIPNSDICVVDKTPNVTEMSEISKLISKYGEWGSVVCDEEGKILINSEYAFTAKQMGYGVLAYCIPNSQKEEFMRYISRDYGSYNFDNLPIKTYHQFLAQPNRLSVSGGRKNCSFLYDKYIIPKITKKTRLVDVGAGRFRYVDALKSQGYDICGYEPSLMKLGSNSIDIRSVVSHILEIEKKVKSDGLFDICILEAVINSVENDTFENIVLTTCNSLLNENGALVTCTRNIKTVEATMQFKKNAGTKNRQLRYLDDNGYTISVKNGIAYKQKFHSTESYKALLERYFDDVQVVDEYTGYIYCVARKPKQLNCSDVESALNEEFNIEYPNGYKHNKHKGLVAAILERVSVRYG